MKNPNTGKTFLDLDDINKVLPTDLVLNPKSIYRGVYNSSNGTLLSISNSRTYPKGAIAWYYVYADRYLEKGVKYMLFTVGLEGLILLPMDAFQDYKKGCYWKEGLKRGEKRYRIDIYKRDGKWLFLNSSVRYEKQLDVTPYFIPFS